MLTISITSIKNYCGEKVYDLAGKYLGLHSNLFCYIDGNQVNAFCQELANGYKVKISFLEGNIVNSICSCKANIKGPCVHIASVLLILNINPEKVPSKNQLACQIETISGRKPDFAVEKMIDINSPVFQLAALA